MKRKTVPTISEPVVVDQALLEKAKLALKGESVKPVTRCVICQSDSAPNSTESLCWVCRRLKISAWRDSEQPITAQE
jgi:Zn finger protein HypA/HybF involved in hydrogenase expression